MPRHKETQKRGEQCTTPCPLAVYAADLDPLAAEQIEQARLHPALEGLIAIMPDAHAGAGCVIGFTGRFGAGVIPNLVGMDIGCGVAAYPLKGVKEIDFAQLDRQIRHLIPLGMKRHSNPSKVENLPVAETTKDAALQLCARIENDFYAAQGFKKHIDPRLQLGTLGGGNHFIEIDRCPHTDTFYLLVHSGSRNLGKQVADHFQRRAVAATRAAGIELPKGMESLRAGTESDAYLHWANVAQEYARFNRRFILATVVHILELDFTHDQVIESIHNYVSSRDGIVRKGAISAHAGEHVVIPLNMAAGTLLGIGKGNAKYNYSAPHGAGRRCSRREMLRQLKRGDSSLKEYMHAMQGVFSTSINAKTFDESPFAYKDPVAIETYLPETVEISTRLKSVYNLKAEG